MPRPAYSLELAPLDYYLLQSMAHFLCLQCFNNQEEVETSMKEFFTLNKNRYQYVIKELSEKRLHPTYSSDLAPSDYYLFWSVVHFLCLQHFNNQEEVKAAVKEFFTSKNKNWSQHEIKERWFQTIKQNGLYIEYKDTFVVTCRE